MRRLTLLCSFIIGFGGSQLFIVQWSLAAVEATLDQAAIERIGGFSLQSNNVLTGGQPTPEQIEALAKAGVNHVINLRPIQEQRWDEGSAVRALGIQYHYLPVSGAKGVTLENARALSNLLKEIDGEPVLVHCASGNRVGALTSIAAHMDDGLSLVDALDKGQQWGMTGLQYYVRDYLLKAGQEVESLPGSSYW